MSNSLSSTNGHFLVLGGPWLYSLWPPLDSTSYSCPYFALAYWLSDFVRMPFHNAISGSFYLAGYYALALHPGQLAQQAFTTTHPLKLSLAVQPILASIRPFGAFPRTSGMV